FDLLLSYCVFFFFPNSATPEIYTLSLHDALPIFADGEPEDFREASLAMLAHNRGAWLGALGRYGEAMESGREAVERNRRLAALRSEEHTSELQSRGHLVCRLLLEKKKKKETE